MESLADNTLKELRSISRGLRPVALEQLDITKAIQLLIDEIDANTDIFFTHEIDQIDSLLDKESPLHLYRILQEALSNMVKHAEAKAASVTVRSKKDSLDVLIQDNGKGFNFEEKDLWQNLQEVSVAVCNILSCLLALVWHENVFSQ